MQKKKKFSILFVQNATTQCFCKLKSLGRVFPMGMTNGIPDVLQHQGST